MDVVRFIMSNQLDNIIFTKHALERVKDRVVDKRLVVDVIKFPDKVITLADGKQKFLKTIGGRRFQVVTTYLKNERKWLVVSVWVRGEKDRKSLVFQVLESLKQLVKWLLKF